MGRVRNKAIEGHYFISTLGDETIITLIPSDEYSYFNTKRALDRNRDTTIGLTHPTKPKSLIYEYRGRD